MTRKEKVKHAIKILIELAVLVLLILLIIYLINSDDGVLDSIDKGDASQKLDGAIKTFAGTEGMTLEEAIRNIEGLDSLEINEETGEYTIKIDGQEFFVVSKEILNGGKEESENNIE